MTNEAEATGFAVVVQFTRSSSKDGGEGFSIRVADGVDGLEAARVMDLAKALRQTALEALLPPTVEDEMRRTFRTMGPGQVLVALQSKGIDGASRQVTDPI